MKKLLKILMYIVLTLIVLFAVAVIATMIFEEDKPFSTLTSNGVTVEIFGQREAETISTSSSADGQKIVMDDHVILFGNGKLTVDGEEQDIGGKTKISIRLDRGKLTVETE